MARYCIHLAYNGSNYCGWQRQPNVASVQQTLEDAFSTLLRRRVAIVGCGRTDTGVHASDFFAHFDADGPLPEQLLFKMNSFLPPDVVLFDLFPVPETFNARFSATARTYHYHVSTARLPFRQGLYNRIYFEPDVETMNRAASVLMQYDDFTSFAKLHTQVKTNICHVSQAEWRREGAELVFAVTANRFLRNMVRAMVGTLLDVGRGALTVDGMRTIVERRDRCAAGTSMPPQGLFLAHVAYPWKEILGREPDFERHKE